jgi:DNA modification methylase/predicted nucleic acid-binding protein
MREQSEAISEAAAVWVPLDRLRPWPGNPRKNDKAVDEVARAIKRFGWGAPIVAREQDGEVISGHTRLEAARRLGLDRVPVRFLNLDPADAHLLAIADNKLGEIATWDDDRLAEILAELRAQDVDLLDGTGLSEYEVADLLGDLEAAESPAPMPPPPVPTTRTGDLWILGQHRLLCGDSASSADLDRLLGEQPVQLVNTDPPYNVRVEPRSNNAIAAARAGEIDIAGKAMPRQKTRGMHHQGLDLARHPEKARPTGPLRAKDRPLANDFLPPAEFEKLLLAWFKNVARALVPGGSAYIWGGYANCANYPPAIAAAGLYFSQSIIWVKEHPVLTRKDFMGNHEWCFYCWKEGAAHWFNPEITNATDVWTVKKVNPQAMVHLTEKPVELAARAILYSSPARGDRVLDLFGGSGSTLIACEQAERNGLLIEIDPAYCDVIIDRWQKLTGANAKLDGDGRTFEQIAAERATAAPSPPAP